MANEQELLNREIDGLLWKYCLVDTAKVRKLILAKLKTTHVKWDREKVAIFLANEIADTYSQEHDFAFDILSMIEQNDFREYADQLHKELTKEGV